ncbi:hypothetical protein C7M84_023046 [Penaeus vannamei]|uniref:Gustatory receptor n=1 Tax=Penaeus vannamei TaxID=6689 RepID=A0A3R7PEI7_PENVA|nr:hypothetical protein C7M84_023046 [Penaeus vannamei]
MEFSGILLGILRVAGGFPYVECRDGTAGSESWAGSEVGTGLAGRKEYPVYKKNRVWALWSRLLAVALLVYAVTSVWALYAGYKPILLPTATLKTAVVIKECVIIFSITSFAGYLIFRESLALELVSELQRFRHSAIIRPAKRTRNALMIFLMVWFTGCYSTNFVIGVSFSSQDLSLYFMAKEVFEFAIWFLINGFAMWFYFAVVSAMSDGYDDLLSSLSALRPSPRTVSGSVGTRRNALGDAAEPTPESPPAEGLFESAAKSLVRIHDLHRLLHRYMAFPVTVSVQVSVITTIISLFFLTFWKVFDGHTRVKVLFVAYFFISALPLAVLCNIPEMLKCRVERLRALLCSLRRLHGDRSFNRAATNLLETLNESPGFKMCGLFTLGRSRVVDISSFTATYLIILIQFLASEASCHSQCCH